MKKLNLLAVILLISTIVFSQQKNDEKFGKGFYNVIAKDSSFSMKFAARFQTLYIGEWNMNDSAGIGQGTSNFLIRRARLKFGGFVFSPKIQYKMEFGLSNRDMSGGSPETKNTPRYILDAVVKWNFYKNFTLWAGQTKLPGNRGRVVSSANLQFVDRSQLNGKFNIDRDIGVQLRHHFTVGKQFVVREIISFSQGEGRNITAGNIGGFEYTGRVEVLPFGKFMGKGDYVGAAIKREEKPKLAIGATYDYNDRAVRKQGNIEGFMYNDEGYFQTSITTFFADLMFKYKGFSLMGEYANKVAADPLAKNTNGTLTGDVVYAGSGFNLQAGYLLKSNWEVAIRYTAITPDSKIGKKQFSQHTIGVSKYVVGHKLKIQSDLSYKKEEGSPDSGLMIRLQFDVHF